MGARRLFPDEASFTTRATKGSIVPVYTEILADMLTPVSSFMRIDQGAYSFLLESVEGGERIGRYSFLGSDPALVIRSKGDVVEVIEGKRVRTVKGVKNPLDEVRKILSVYRMDHDERLPRFCGGLVGYLGYDVVRSFERIPDKNPSVAHVYDMIFVLTTTILIFDHVEHTIKIVYNAIIPDDLTVAGRKAVYRTARTVIERIMKRLSSSTPAPKAAGCATRPLQVRSNMTRQQFMKMVERAKAYILKGDIIQTVLSQRFEVSLKHADGCSLYRALRSVNPSPYMYYLRFADISLVGSSPEMLIRCEDGVVQTRPIAGTRRRGATEEEDGALANELLGDPKERAEHIMLVDLGRNDLGRVCQTGSVRLARFMAVEKYSHVMHIVSEVIGRLRPERDIYDLIASTFPAGTVSGAPKVRAMEIIDELEPTRRGPYAGCIGYIGFSGNLDTCIVIRTIMKIGKKAYVQAGAGIVADSDPAREYEETVNKAKALITAIEKAEAGLE